MGAVAFGRLALDDTPSEPSAASPLPAFVHPVPASGPFASPFTAGDALVQEVRRLVGEEYYRPVSPEVLGLPSIALILRGLDDPYSEYLPPDRYGQLRERLTRRYFGVGLTVAQVEGGLQVTSLRSGPAHEAGIRPGDLIVAVNGERASHLDRALDLIRGEAGTVVSLRVRRPGLHEPVEFRIVRAPIELPSVRTRLLQADGHRVAYLRIMSFSSGVSYRVKRAVRALQERGADALILDLRGNPGGLLSEAISVTSLFVPSGLVCSVEGEHQAHVEHEVLGDAIETRHPLAVLVDGQSASAAEVVAAALRDHGRAIVVGERTYGKATVQALFPLSNGGVLRLTTARYLTPGGESIGGAGIKPDLEVVDELPTPVDEQLAAAKRTVVEGI